MSRLSTFLSVLVVALLATGPAHAGVIGAAIAAINAFAATSVYAAFAVRIGFSLVFSALGQVLRGRPDRPRQAGIKNQTTTTGGTNPQSFLLGRYATAGNMVAPPYSHPNSGGTPNKYLTYVVDLGDVPGVELLRLMVSGEYVEDIQPSAGDHEFEGMFVDGVPHLFYTFHDGFQTSADAYMMANYADHPDRPWSADMVGTGVPYVVVTFLYNRDLFNQLPGVRFEALGILFYDPRKDSSVGGSGSHRWEDPSTWETPLNPMVMIYGILRGLTLPDGRRWGGAVPAEDLPLDNWFAAMNECDVAIELDGGGTVPQFTAGLEVSLDTTPAAIIEELLKACSAEITEFGGVYKVRVGPPALPVYFFTDDDVVADLSRDLKPYPGLEGVHNAIHATHPDPAALWESRDAPPRYNAEWEAEDGGRQLVAQVDLPAVFEGTQAQRLMKGWIEDERRFRRHGLTLPPDAAMLEPLDCVSWTSVQEGYTAKVFEVGELSDDLVTCLQTVALREREQGDFVWVPGRDQVGVGVVSTVTTKPDPRTLPGFDLVAHAITDEASAVRRPAVRLVWLVSDLLATDVVEYQLQLQDGTAVAAGLISGPLEGFKIIAAGVLPVTGYRARARLVSRQGAVWTDWAYAVTADIRLAAGDLGDEVQETLTDAEQLRADHDARVATVDAALADASGQIAGVSGAVVAVQADVDAVIADLADVKGSFDGNLDDLDDAVADALAYADGAAEGVRMDLQGQIDGVSATLSTGYYAIAEMDQVLAAALLQLQTDMESPSGSIGQLSATLTNEHYTRLQVDEAVSYAVTEMQATLEGPMGSIGQLEALLANEYVTLTQMDQVVAQALLTLQATLEPLVAAAWCIAPEVMAEAEGLGSAWVRWAQEGAFAIYPSDELPNAWRWRFAMGAGDDDGVTTTTIRGQWVGPADAEAYYVEVDYTLNSGDIGGFGIRVDWVNTAGTSYFGDITGPTAAPAYGKKTRYGVIHKRPEGFVGTLDYVRVYAFANASWLAGAATKSIDFHRVGVRPATDEEVGKGQVAAAFMATLTEGYLTEAETDQAVANAMLALQAAMEGPSGSIGSLTATIEQDYLAAVDTMTAIAAATAQLRSELESPTGSIGSLTATVEQEHLTGVEVHSAIAAASLELQSQIDGLDGDIGSLSATVTQDYVTITAFGDALGAAVTEVEAFASAMSRSGVSSNPYFSDWEDEAGAPKGYSLAAPQGEIIRNSLNVKYRHAVQMETAANPSDSYPQLTLSGVENGDNFAVPAHQVELVQVTAEVELVDGDWGGANFQVYWLGVASTHKKWFVADHLPDTKRVILPVSFILERPVGYVKDTAFDEVRLRFQSTNSAGGGYAYNKIRVHSMDWRSIDGSAESAVYQSALVTDELQSAAYVARVGAGGASAGLEMAAVNDLVSGPASSILFHADNLLFDGTVSFTKTRAGRGQNLLHNADFSQGLAGTSHNKSGTIGANSTMSVAEYGAAKTLRMQIDTSSSDGWAGVWFTVPTVDGGLDGRSIPVEAGAWYEFAAQLRCQNIGHTTAYVAWVNESGVTFANSTVYDDAAPPGASSISPGTWPRYWQKAQAPAGAVYARPHIRFRGVDAGQSAGSAWLYRPYFGETHAAAEEFSGWGAGPITVVDGGNIRTGSITAGIGAFANGLTVGDYVPGVSGMFVDENVLEINQAILRGSIVDGAVSDGGEDVAAAGIYQTGAVIMNITMGEEITPGALWALSVYYEMRSGGASLENVGSAQDPDWQMVAHSVRGIFRYRLKTGGVWGGWINLHVPGWYDGTGWQVHEHVEHLVASAEDMQVQFVADTNGDTATQNNFRTMGMNARAVRR